MRKVLVTFITATGSTEEVAKRIARVMEEEGHSIDVMPLDAVKDISTYETVIVGAPVNGMTWKEEAFKFVKEYEEELNRKKVAYFALGMMAKQGRVMWQNRVHKVLNKPSKVVTPIDIAIFGGVAGSGLPKIMEVIFGIPKDSSPDQRDWTYIEKWAREVSKKIS